MNPVAAAGLPAGAAFAAPTSTSVASMLSAENRVGSGWLTPEATKRALLTLTGGCAADSAARSAMVMVRLHGSNDTLPWLALAPVARIFSNAASTSSETRCCA
jgi:hypothetical protein